MSTTRGTGWRVLGGTTALVAALIVLVPTWWVIVSSTRSNAEIFEYTNPLTWRTFSPLDASLHSYRAALDAGMGRAIYNSAVVTVGSVLGALIINGLAGFAFARYQFRGRSILFATVVATALLPFEVTAIPLYRLFSQVGLVDNYAALIIPAIPNGLAILMFRQFFMSIPRELHEAASLDGCGPLTTLWHVYAPVSLPVLASASITIFSTQWESFLWPLLVTRSENMAVIQLALGRFQGQHGTDWSTLFAGSTMGCILPLLLLLPLQRYYRPIDFESGIRD